MAGASSHRTSRPKPAERVAQRGTSRLGGGHAPRGQGDPAPAMTNASALVLTACSGFLLAVLWMDLIFDSQVVAHRHSSDQLPEAVLASIAGYYHRATTTSRPMSFLIVVVMLILLTALAVR